jgi:leader peptidase (prepilin peptidase)/N-methyltransferase
MILLGSPIIFHDIQSHRIPNSLVAMMCVSALLLDLGYPVNQMISRLSGGVFTSIITIALLLISGGGLGMGDVKLIIALGFCIGNFQQSLTAIFASLIIGLIWMLVSSKKIIPFAPALLVGFISSNFWL